ncbi:hypothetical protein [Halomonas sp. A29]|uniref:hypothetical protein n=1 Tax=Halomonas sp. A29 TaxID=3102786 RepID=UPI00398B71DA
MKLNLNDKSQFTVDGVKALIASKDDSQSRQLRVTKEGVAYLSDEVGNLNTEGLAFRLETWDAGNDYVGEAASNDPKWVQRIYDCLSKSWPNPKDSYIDFF